MNFPRRPAQLADYLGANSLALDLAVSVRPSELCHPQVGPQAVNLRLKFAKTHCHAAWTVL